MSIQSIQLGFHDGTQIYSFYKAVLQPLGYNYIYGNSAKDLNGIGIDKVVHIWFREFKDPGKKNTQCPFSFAAKDRKQVDEAYLAAMKSGGKDNGAPAFQDDYGPGHYIASIIDPEGNEFNIVAA